MNFTENNQNLLSVDHEVLFFDDFTSEETGPI